MAASYLVGLDVGGRSGRCALVNVETGGITSAVRKWAPRIVPGSGGFGYEFDPDEYLRQLAEACREAIQKSGAKTDEVKGIACASIRHSLVLVDDAEHELIALPNKDGRSGGEGLMLAMEHGDELYTRCGHYPSAIFLAARLQWVKANHPELLEKAKAALAPSDWLGWRLTGGAHATDLTQAGESLLIGLKDETWNSQLAEMLGIPFGLLPPIRSAGASLGKLTSGMAELFGLNPGTPVFIGGADTQMAMLGMGAVKPGDLAIVSGSTTPVMMAINQPIVDANQKVWTSRHAVDGLWVLESNAGPMGETLEWMSALINPVSPNPIARFCAQAAKAKPDAEGMLAAPAAQVMDAKNLTLPLATFMFNQMDEFDGKTRQGLMARSTLEGLAFIGKANADQLVAASSNSTPKYFLAGGMTRSDFWCQLVSNILNEPVQVSESSEASGLGAALAAGVGAGIFKDLDEAVAKLVHTQTVDSNPKDAAFFKDLYGEWSEWYQKQKDARDLAAGHNMNAVIERASLEESSTKPLPKLKMLVTAQFDESGLTKLRQLGEVDYQNYRDTLNVMSGSDLGEALKDSNVLITEVDMVDVDALNSAPNLRVVVSCRGNAVNIDLPACTAFGVPVLNAPGRNADAVAELAISFMLMLLRKLAPASQFLHEPGGEAGDLGRSGMAFTQFLGGELWGKTVGLVGLGAVGRAVARRLQGFGANVLVYDPYLSADEINLIEAEPASLDELLACSDIVSLHAAVTDETRGMIGKAQFDKMKPEAILINTARAALVDETALEEALKSGKLAGAGLDVFAVEPPSADHPLLQLENVVATPHIGGNTVEVAAHQGSIVAEDLTRLAKGQPPLHILNREVLKEFDWISPRKEPDEQTLSQLASTGGPAVSDLMKTEKPAEPAKAIAEEIKPEGSMKMEAKPDTSVVKDRMQKILHGFIQKGLASPAFKDYAAKHNLAMVFTMTDIGLDFYFQFKDGQVLGDVKTPEYTPEVALKATASDMDGVLTGKLGGMKAATTGKLKFSGEVRKAMTMQKLMNDWIKLYSEAREEAGGVDLSSLAAPKIQVPTATHVISTTPAGTTLSPDDPRVELVQVTLELYAANSITATGGNVSVRVPDTTDQCYITPSHLFKGNLRPEMMVRIDMNGNALDEGALTASSEKAVHTEIYRARPDVEAVVHGHSPWITLLMLNNLPLLPISVDAGFFPERIPCVPFIMPGTSELAVKVKDALGIGVVAYMQNHGVVVAGSSLRQAANNLEALERTAMLTVWSRAIRSNPKLLPKDVLKTLKDMGNVIG